MPRVSWFLIQVENCKFKISTEIANRKEILLILLFIYLTGVLSVENFFKNSGQSVQSIKATASDSNQLIIDNILVKLKSVTVSRAIMTLTRDLEVQVKSNILIYFVVAVDC